MSFVERDEAEREFLQAVARVELSALGAELIDARGRGCGRERVAVAAGEARLFRAGVGKTARTARAEQQGIRSLDYLDMLVRVELALNPSRRVWPAVSPREPTWATLKRSPG